MKSRITSLLCLSSYWLFFNVLFAQFPNPTTLSTGQGNPGTQDPIWQCSPWSSTIPGNPMGETYGPTLINNNCAPGAWVNPSALPAPLNNGNWITGTESNCATNTNDGYRYFRLTLDLPPDCNGFSVTEQGNYILSFDGYVDNYIHDVFINGNSQAISGGGFSPGSQLSIYLDGPWVVGLNYIDILVYNAPSNPVGGQNPYGLLLVANGTNSANMDLDNDGISDLDDLCPCDAGVAPHGCPDPVSNTCDIDLIRNTFINAGCIELPLCYSDCSMYFLNPSPNSGSSAQAYAETFGANLISIQDAAENECIINELNRIGQSGVIWIGFNDEQTEGSFVWYDQSPITYTNWAPGEPNNTGGNEDCTQIYPDGMWNDLNCNTANAKSIIEVNLCPVVEAYDVIICSNETTTITTSNPILGSAPYTFSWSNSSSTQTQTVPTTDASYIVTVTDRYNCSVKDTATVTTKPVPVASVTPTDTLICSGEVAPLSVTSNLSGTAFDWVATPNNVSGAINASGNSISHTLHTGTPSNGSVTYTITPSLNGCTGTDVQSVVTVEALPVIAVSPAPATICNGDSVTITATGANTYTWSPATGLNTTSGNVINASPTSTQNYTVTGTSNNGCVNTSQTSVTVNPVPQITLNHQTESLCTGETTSFQISATPSGASISWTATATNITGAANGNGGSISQALTTSGNGGTVVYTITATLNGCESTTTASVNVHPTTHLTDNVSICNYDLPLVWNSQTITSGGMAVATHTTQDANGCDVVTTLNLTVHTPPNQSFISDVEDCLPATLTLTPVNTPSNGTCTWLVNGQVITGDCAGAAEVITQSGCQDVTFTVTDVNGCTTMITQNNAFCVAPAPDAQFSVQQVSNTTMQTSNNSSDATYYEWILPTGTTSEFSPVVCYNEHLGEQSVTLYAYNSVGCVDSMTIQLDWPTSVPNIITPNGDGVNDYFIIAGLVPNSELIILNRWGNIIFQTTSYTNNWDGRSSNGSPVTEGVYTYIYKTPEGIVRHGFLHVER